ncbi:MULTISPECIES: type II secretion system F family protein [Sphingopyxis]|jgi:tight adherence protein B|uniref:Flp pilus assembly protein TadB n=1 Tax=Sphingopyxis granuli TaxID=267128 RepID=A0AA86GJY9_9SPHN|nr:MULTISPECIES: type II secretion system F family protein [Sphingopyxis]AMG74279.1 Flp pilus assembly protein TadB [Sphingopyxis granuli]APW74212.1 pilus assembly protein TadB [Sphingopyxis granuli]AVA14050.1 pilus assembly protein TadB [Sphingopyxis sp. MG]ODU27858.1 MAG: pilus assembly protein TadB [Sphingopyxis sp. SCN 67-31]QUM70872.1 type II secretion system F family protein [Sphingopyxis granuli]
MNLPVILIIATAFLAFAALVVLLGGPSAGKAKSRRLASVKDRHAASTEAVVAAQMRKTIQASSAGSNRLSSLMPRREQMELRLRRTGKTWNITQYMFATMILFVVVAALMLIMRAPFMLAILFGLLAGIGLPYMIVGRLIKKRVTQFTTRFPDAIDLLVRGLRSGLPVTETFQVVSQELPGPVGEEFRGIIERIRIGNTMEAALQESADMLGTPEFQFFCITIAIQRETGGNLAETLGNLSDVLRKRAQMKLKIRAMSSEAKASAYIVGSLPFFVFGIVWMMNPEYLSGFFHEERLMIAGMGGLIWMSLGAFIMSRMISFEI